MLDGHRTRANGDKAEAQPFELSTSLHPTWREFVRYCAELEFGEIDKLKIQDGLPVLAEVTKKKVKFG